MAGDLLEERIPPADGKNVDLFTVLWYTSRKKAEWSMKRRRNDGKMICRILLTGIGLTFSAICFLTAVCNPWNENGIDGWLGSLLGTHTFCLFILSFVAMIGGLGICFWLAFRKGSEECISHAECSVQEKRRITEEIERYFSPSREGFF